MTQRHDNMEPGRPRHARRGLTLVELLVTLVVLGIGLVGAVQCLSAAMLLNQKANRVAVATAIAQNGIENARSAGELSADDFGSVVTQGTTVTGTTNLGEPLLPGGRLVVVLANYNTALKLSSVTATVTWRGARARPEQVQMYTIMMQRQRHVGG